MDPEAQHLKLFKYQNGNITFLWLIFMFLLKRIKLLRHPFVIYKIKLKGQTTAKSQRSRLLHLAVSVYRISGKQAQH